MTSTGTEHIGTVSQQLFASYGLPLQLVSDNGPQFTAAEFQQFLKGNGVKHIRCSPYHPSFNGLAERFIKTFKQAMWSGEADGLHRLQNLLLSYQAIPHATTNRSLSSLSLHQPIQAQLDLLHPSCHEHVLQQQTKQQMQHDQRAIMRNFEVGETVMIRNYQGKSKRFTDTILKKCAPLSYQVKTHCGLNMEMACRSIVCSITQHQ